MTRKKWSRWKTVRARDIRQDIDGTCYLLSASVNNLKYRQHKRRNTIQLQLYDFDYQPFKVKQRLNRVGNLSAAIEDAYIKSYPKWYAKRTGGIAANALMDITGIQHDRTLVGSADEILGQAQVGEVIESFSMSLWNLPDAHAYSVVGNTGDSLTLYNPWQTDGYGTYDGVHDGYITLNRNQLDVWTSEDVYIAEPVL